MTNTAELVARAIADCPIDLCDDNDEYFAPALAAIDAHLAAIEAQGMVIVPRVPTTNMYNAGDDFIDKNIKLRHGNLHTSPDGSEVWQAMIKASQEES